MIIDRSKWLYGQKFETSCLYSEMDQRYCCLGFLGMHLGAKTKDFSSSIELPSDAKNICEWPNKLFEINKYELNFFSIPIFWEDELSTINDCISTDNETRESWIAAGFKILFDIDVEFVGKY